MGDTRHRRREGVARAAQRRLGEGCGGGSSGVRRAAGVLLERHTGRWGAQTAGSARAGQRSTFGAGLQPLQQS